MKLTSDATSETIFETDALAISKIIGAMFVLFALLSLSFDWQPWRLHCERGGDCDLKTRALMGVHTERFPLASLHGPALDSRPGSKGRTVYRVVLNTAQGVLPLTTNFSSGEGSKSEVVGRIVRVVASGVSFRLHDWDGWPLGLAGAQFAVGFGAIVLGSQRFRVSIRRERGVLEVARMSLLGTKPTCYPLRELASLTVTPSGKDNDTPDVEVVLKTTSGATAFSVIAPQGAATDALLLRLGHELRLEATPAATG